MLREHQAIKVFADYHQFYLWDAGVNPKAPDDYTEDDVKRRIKTGSNVVVIQPERNMTVDVEIEIHDAEPAYDPTKWDHIAEASLILPTGRLQIHECTGGVVAEFQMAPGSYRVRSFHGGFDTIDESGLEGNDYYLAVLWPAPVEDIRILKQWTSKQAL